MRDRFVGVTTRILDRDPRTALVLADISVDRFRQCGALERHPERIVNVGIREQAMIGVAAGLALEGFRVLAHSFAPFLVERPFEQVKLDLGHQGVAAILVGVGASDDIAAMGRTHQAPADVALLATLPGWQIHVPGHPDEVETILDAAARGDGNVYVRLSDQANRAPMVSAAGRVEVVRRAGAGAPIALAVGPMLDPLLDATSDLDLTVLYTATVQPLDGEALRAVAGAADAILVEPTLQGTSLPAFAEALGDRARRLLAIGEPAEELRRYGSAAEHRRAHGLDAAGLHRRIATFLDAGVGGARA